jgi:hypothetical protein
MCVLPAYLVERNGNSSFCVSSIETSTNSIVVAKIRFPTQVSLEVSEKGRGRERGNGER